MTTQQSLAKQALVNESKDRLMYAQHKDKMKRLLRSLANTKDEVPVSDVMLAAQLANFSITPEEQTLLFKTPYANQFASTWETSVGTPRTSYGLECPPKSVKWRAFDSSIKHPSARDQSVEAMLRKYANKEADAIAQQEAEQRRAVELARAKTVETGRVVEPLKTIPDEQLRMVHRTVKAKLGTQFSNLHSAFRAMDEDGSGTISPEECCKMLMKLQLGVPEKFVQHLVNVADYDRDGEINYREFTRILECEDITKIKVQGAEAEGLVAKDEDMWKPGIRKSELISAQTKIKDMLEERGGITKMFRVIDEDKSGWASRAELRSLMVHLNLEAVVRPAILEELMTLMDTDKDDKITLKEFARVCTNPANEIFNDGPLEAAAVAPPTPEKPKQSLRNKKKMMKMAYGM